MSNIEEHIRQAMAEGKFDNLKGKGKKLELEDNPHANPEWDLAHHMLHSSGFTLPWIETRQDLESEIAAMRAALCKAWEWRAEALADRKNPAGLVAAEWERAQEKLRQTIIQLNKRIRSFNLEAPSEKMHLPILTPERELARLEDADQSASG